MDRQTDSDALQAHVDALRAELPKAVKRLAQIVEKGSDRDAISAIRVMTGLAGMVPPAAPRSTADKGQTLADLSASELRALVDKLAVAASDNAQNVRVIDQVSVDTLL